MPAHTVSRSTTSTVIDLIAKAQARRRSLSQNTNCVRLVNGLGDGMDGVFIDMYAGALQVFLYHHLDQTAELTLLQALHHEFPEAPLILKRRYQPSGETMQQVVPELLRGTAEDAIRIVSERGVRFQVDLLDHVNPGLFLDMRRNRMEVADLAGGRTLVNLFSYTCAFAVHARSKGCLSAVNVDVSSKSLERGRLNYELNGLAPGKGEFFRGDGREFMAWSRRTGRTYDVAVLDPPTFARAKSSTWQVERDLPGVLEDCVATLNPGGHLFVSTNCSALTSARLKDLVFQAVAACKRSVLAAHVRGQDVDFPGTGSMKESMLSAWLVQLR